MRLDKAGQDGAGHGRALRGVPVVLALLPVLAGCAVIGPTLPVRPGPGRTSVTLAVDRRACMAETDAQVQPVATRPGSSAAQIQTLYNTTFGRCMASRGNVVDAATPATTRVAQGVGTASATGLRDPDSIAARQSLASVVEGYGKACEGERIEVAVTEAVVSPAADARSVDLSTPQGGNCFGEPGRNAYLVAKVGTGWRTLLSAEPGSIQILNSKHGGYADLELHSLGLCVYTYHWNGGRYVQAGSKNCSTNAPPTLSTLSRAIRRN